MTYLGDLDFRMACQALARPWRGTIRSTLGHPLNEAATGSISGWRCGDLSLDLIEELRSRHDGDPAV
jgi:hypothetical protein